MEDTQPALSVKAFVQTRIENKIKHEVVSTPAGSVPEAQTLFDEYLRNNDCQAAYIYRGDRIIASWDRHADYLVAIHDIREEERYDYHTFLSAEERDQLEPEVWSIWEGNSEGADRP